VAYDGTKSHRSSGFFLRSETVQQLQWRLLSFLGDKLSHSQNSTRKLRNVHSVRYPNWLKFCHRHPRLLPSPPHLRLSSSQPYRHTEYPVKSPPSFWRNIPPMSLHRSARRLEERTLAARDKLVGHVWWNHECDDNGGFNMPGRGCRYFLENLVHVSVMLGCEF
jgi:hypothetical protein